MSVHPEKLRAAAALVCGLLCGLAGPAWASTVPLLPDFAAATFVPGQAIDNPYFPVLPGPGARLEAQGINEDGEVFVERIDLRFDGAGPVIAGVATTVLRDRAYEDGVLVEETFDFYAQDSLGNVWYMGEDVTNYNYDADGDLIGTDSASSWRAGVNGAKPGYAMPADALPGLAYYQEFAHADKALDEGLILGFLDTLDVSGVTFADVLMVFESSAIDPALREIKYYAPGFGLIRADEGVDADYRNPTLVLSRVATVPVPASGLVLLAGVALLAGAGRRLRRAGRAWRGFTGLFDTPPLNSMW
jgi:hypothetical protein